MPQDLVLSATSPGRARRARLRPTADNGFPRAELAGGEVDVTAAGQPIPVVVADLDLADEDLADDQFAAEQVLNDQRGHSALTTSRIARMPIPQIVRVAGIRSPAGPHCRTQRFQADRSRAGSPRLATSRPLSALAAAVRGTTPTCRGPYPAVARKSL